MCFSVVEFIGQLLPSGFSNGHYRCDVKDSTSNKWFRTNDDGIPISIDEADVSKQGYAILMRKRD